MNKVIKGNIETIDQLSDFIGGLSEAEYNYTHGTVLSSSIGQHLRHILDLYHSLMTSSGFELVDYDIRRRGAALETDKSAGVAELKAIRQWVIELTSQQLEGFCTVKTEVMLSDSSSVTAESTVQRELCFVSSHLTHHLALMAISAKLAGCEVSDNVGLAPATASFVRSQQPNEVALAG
ncbi:DinB family protein [Parendozoicomonas sp. Alg238-R29]|uniref:DinB family protein n=1 Tax=Parendozoicomonas sp. Alg238-R29 TaxID=2993446 RepID=UPI00248EDC8E|nr:DinB family protein [Parendozoicomonas sp. Alg238-R29]